MGLEAFFKGKLNWPLIIEAYNHLILENFSQQGIISAQAAASLGLCIPSRDQKLSELLSVNVVKLEETQYTLSQDALLNKLTSDVNSGLYYIPLERSIPAKTDSDQHALKILSLRAQNNIVFVLDIQYDFPLTLPVQELRLDKAVAPQQIKAIIAPMPWAQVAQKYFSQVEIISVAQSSQQLMLGPMVVESLPRLKPYVPYTFNVPDYKTGVATYMNTHPDKKFALHITRLAHAEDLNQEVLLKKQRKTPQLEDALIGKIQQICPAPKNTLAGYEDYISGDNGSASDVNNLTMNSLFLGNNNNAK